MSARLQSTTARTLSSLHKGTNICYFPSHCWGFPDPVSLVGTEGTNLGSASKESSLSWRWRGEARSWALWA